MNSLPSSLVSNVEETELREQARSMTADFTSLQLLYDLGNYCLDPKHDKANCLDEVLKTAMAISGTNRGNIQLLDSESRQLCIAAHRGFQPRFLRFFERVDTDCDSVCGVALAHAGRVFVEDIERSDIFANTTALEVLRSEGIRAVQSTPLLSSSGHVLGMISTHFSMPHRPDESTCRFLDLLARQVADFLERRRAEELLAQNERTFAELVERSPFGIYVVDASFHIVSMNASGQQGAFANVRPLIGRNFEEAMRILWPEEVAREIIAHFRHTLKSGEPFYSHDFTRGRNDITETESYEWELHRLILPNGQPGVICYYFDSTRLRKAEVALREAKEQAERASRAKDEFLAALSHELRNPLNPVLLCAAELSQDGSLSTRVRDDIGMIKRNIELEARLIDDLLDLTRIARGKLSVDLLPADAHDLLRHTEEIVRADAVAAGVDLQFELSAQSHFVQGDAARLHQVFWNLIKNAIKFSAGIGRVTVRTFNPVPDKLAIEVADNGVGISPSSLSTIFQPFEQGELGHQHRFGGLGLGLAISKAIVDLHNGHLAAESEGQGCGAKFTLELSTTNEPAPKHVQNAECCTPPSSLRLLLVEDHAATLDVLTKLLERDGHRVFAAASAEQAITLAESIECDLVISDLGLPDASRHDLMRQLRSRHGLQGIALSGYGTDADLKESDEAGFSAHLVKPINPAALRDLLAKISKGGCA